ncbi:MAG: NADH-quinone oxidoreductase subunit N, partial [Opitutales bacterium]
MPTHLLQAAAESNQWWAITPELVLGGGALFLLFAEIVLPRHEHRYIPLFAVAAQVAALLGM